MIDWQDKHHAELDVPTLYKLLKLRCEVFVVEQTLSLSGCGRRRSGGRKPSSAGLAR